MTIEMTTQMWIELFIGSTLAGLFSAILVNGIVYLGSELQHWVKCKMNAEEDNMAQETFFDKVRSWLGGVAFNIFLWSTRMTLEEYVHAIVTQADAPIVNPCCSMAGGIHSPSCPKVLRSTKRRII